MCVYINIENITELAEAIDELSGKDDTGLLNWRTCHIEDWTYSRVPAFMGNKRQKLKVYNDV